MLKRVALICLFLAVATPSHAQAPAENESAAEPLVSRAVMTSDQVIRILDETVDWYRMLGVQQQSATQPSDLLILYANRQTAERVVAVAFEIARANTELLSSQAEVQEDASAADPASPQTLLQSQRELDNRQQAIKGEIAGDAGSAAEASS